MKVVFFEAYPGFRGAQRSLLALIEELARLDVEPSILCAVEGRASQGYEASGWPVRVLPAPGQLGTYGGALMRRGPAGRLMVALRDGLPYTLRVSGELRRERPMLLHCNQARGLLLAGPAARLLGIPVLWHQRGQWDLSPGLGRVCRRLAHGLVCVSEAVRESLSPHAPALTGVIPNGIDPATAPSDEDVRASRRRLEAVAAERGIESPWVVVTASSPVPYKGLHHLVRALARLVARQHESGRRILWLALGADEPTPGVPIVNERYMRYLQRIVADHDLERHVVWHGWHEDPLPWIAAADVLVLPTVERELIEYEDGSCVEVRGSEGFPRTVLEGMLVGTPIVASRASGVPEQIVEGESGLLVPPADPEALEGALTRLMEQPDLAARLVRFARQRIENFEPRAMAEKVRAFYDRLAGPRQAGRRVKRS